MRFVGHREEIEKEGKEGENRRIDQLKEEKEKERQEI